MTANAIWELAKKYRTAGAQQINLEKPDDLISTGSIRFNKALGTGGYLRGRLIEIYGPPDTGKTTLGVAAAHQAAKMGELTAYIDQDHKLSKNQIRQAGVTTDKTMFFRFSTAHVALTSILHAVSTGRFALIVVDTLGSMFPDIELESTTGDFLSEMDSLFYRALPRMAALAARTDTCVLILNQVRGDNRAIYRDPLTTPGGHVLRHSCSVRIELRRKSSLTDTSRKVLGCLVEAKVTKNCVADPHGLAELAITHSRGLDQIYEALSIADDRSMVRTNNPACLEYRGVTLGTNLIEAHEYLRVHPVLASTLLSDIESRDSGAAAL